MPLLPNAEPSPGASWLSLNLCGGRPQPWGIGRFSAHRASAPLWYLDPEMTMGTSPLQFPALGTIAGAVSGYLKTQGGVSKSQGQCEA